MPFCSLPYSLRAAFTSSTSRRGANWHHVPLAGPIVYVFNSDSPVFARIVVTFPAGLSDSPQGRTRLMRPLYSAAGWVVLQPLRVFRGLVPPALSRRVAAKMGEANNADLWSAVDPREIVLAWGALVIVSVIMLWGSLLLVREALLAIFPETMATLLAVSLAFHFKIIQYVYVPHTGPFDLLIPAIALYCAARVWPRQRTGWLGACALGIAFLGKAVAYPACNWLYEHLARRPWRSGLKRTILLALVVCAPTGLYAALLLMLGIEPVSHEVSEYRQGVWMLDYLRAGRGGDILVRWADGLVLHAGHTLFGFAAPLAVVACVSTFRNVRPACPLPPGLLAHLVVLALAGSVFWILLGYIQLRLTTSHYPAVIVALGYVCARKCNRPLAWVGASIMGQVALFLGGVYE